VAEVATQPTTATATEALRALSDGHLEALGTRPTLARLLVLAACSALETGRWQRFNNHNVGGIKATADWRGDVAAYGTREVLGGVSQRLRQPFRAYASLTEGFADWCRLLANRYAPALARADAYDPRGTVREMKRLRYFTADESEYADAVVSLAAEYSHLPMVWADLCDGGGAGES
jgi:flagellum-specific peptidoglycan hydrolase FlgJ